MQMEPQCLSLLPFSFVEHPTQGTRRALCGCGACILPAVEVALMIQTGNFQWSALCVIQSTGLCGDLPCGSVCSQFSSAFSSCLQRKRGRGGRDAPVAWEAEFAGVWLLSPVSALVFCLLALLVTERRVLISATFNCVSFYFTEFEAVWGKR